MVDYYSIKELLRGTDNMTIIRDNSGNDDGTDTVTGVGWFTYNSVAAENIYVNGNSWMGIGSNAEQVKVHRRDAKVWTIRREEGTIYGYYKFLRIRWEGYSYYSATSEDVRLVWDLILLDTKDIVLRFEKVPTNASYLGECVLVTGAGNISFTPAAGKMIHFEHQDDTGTAFVMADGEPLLLDPYNRRYLVTDAAGDIYTVEEGALMKLAETELTAEVFETYGVQDIPDGALLLTLTDPTILYWHDSENHFPPFTASYTGVPKPQVIYSENIDMSDASIIGIEKVTVDADDNALFAVSFDDGETWWTCVEGTWAQLSEEKSGMTKAGLEGISTNVWSEKAVTGQLKYRIVISGENGYVKTITTDYLNTEE
ncbi:MAG TPA: hypothetical protein PLN48_07645 [Lachnospiraceae bacterium]|nr:hypothetical protein [Lachnospiraceae bacterium]